MDRKAACEALTNDLRRAVEAAKANGLGADQIAGVLYDFYDAVDDEED